MAKLFHLFAFSALIVAFTQASARGKGASKKVLIKKETIDKPEQAVRKNPAKRKRKTGPVKDDLSTWGYFDAGVQAASARREAFRAISIAQAQTEPLDIAVAESPAVSSPDATDEPISSSSNKSDDYYPAFFEAWFDTLLAQYDDQGNMQDDPLIQNLFPDSGSHYSSVLHFPSIELDEDDWHNSMP